MNHARRTVTCNAPFVEVTVEGRGSMKHARRTVTTATLHLLRSPLKGEAPWTMRVAL